MPSFAAGQQHLYAQPLLRDAQRLSLQRRMIGYRAIQEITLHQVDSELGQQL